MSYIYNVELNFLPDYFDFYEWRLEDKVCNFKKLPLILVDTKNYLSLKYNEVIIDKNSIPQINKYFLVTNKCEVMAIEVNDKYEVIRRSSLLFDEGDDILNNLNKIKITEIKFKKNIDKKRPSISRREYDINKYLLRFYSKVDLNKDKYLLKYIYYELYDLEENDINMIMDRIKKEDKIRLYNAIQNVNKELNNYIKI